MKGRLIQVFGKSNILLFFKSMENQDQLEKVSRHKGTKSGTSGMYKGPRAEVNELKCQHVSVQ